jgi:hypothetical protein
VRVVVGRKWHKPDIYTRLDKEGIDLQMELDDFVLALLDELGSPTMIMTRAQLKARVHQAVEKVVSGIKDVSREVV